MIGHAMDYAKFISKKSPDEKMKVGCVIFDSHTAETLAVGYNGNPDPLPQVRDSLEPGKGGFLHAEVRAAIQCAAEKEVKKEVYVTLPPCKNCAKVLIELGNVGKLYYLPNSSYSLEGCELLKSVGIEVIECEL
jgi:deoxycytidylate deaminase